MSEAKKPSSDAKNKEKSTTAPAVVKDKSAKETGGPKGPEPTRYGDWEIGGKCVDF